MNRFSDMNSPTLLSNECKHSVLLLPGYVCLAPEASSFSTHLL